MVMKRKIKRTIDFRYKLICYWCATGEIQYQSQFSNVHEEKIKDEDEWTESLAMWGDRMRPGLIEFLERAAKQKCKKYGRAESICWRYEVEEPGFQFGEEVVLVPEEVPEEIPEKVVPEEVVVPTGIIEAIKGYERSAKALRDAASRIPIPELRDDFEKRADELEEKARELRKKYGMEGKEL